MPLPEQLPQTRFAFSSAFEVVNTVHRQQGV
jgi:hypothetical protein